MRINFFEEYPTEENLSKLDMVDWPTTVLVAAPSLLEFESIRDRYSTRYPSVTFGWWPTIPGSYWVSGFSSPKDLVRLFNELTSIMQTKELAVLMDLELPLRISMYIKNILNIRYNKRLIADFFRKAPGYNLRLYTAEYPAPNRLLHWLWEKLGISPSFAFPHTKLPMVYTSMGRAMYGDRAVQRIQTYEKAFALAHPGRIGFGLGTIATGVLGNEPILPPEALVDDLRWVKEAGAEEVFIFRLGGLTNDYIAYIQQFVS